MPREPRDFHEGLNHIAAHASDNRALFPGDPFRNDFLDQLADVNERYGIRLVSYCLMGTHYHTVVHTPDRRISLALKKLHGDYSRHTNRILHRGAHLFRAHPFAKRIDDDQQLLITCRYLALNPVEAGLAHLALLWPWTSSRATAGLQQPRIPLHEQPFEAALGNTHNWRHHYQELIATNDEGPPKQAL